MSAERPLSFQEILLRLNEFWAAEGCLIWQPHNVQVGAGTMNPATFLRVLGPEPWNVAYVEPSVRPADGRYGKNPFRLRQYFQYQVILKPDPGDPQERYLRSLEVLGVDLRRHDLRFVEDNWEAPALGAWGLGWEVWLDAQEVTQFTYFQQAGGVSLDPVSVEITYGLERLAMYLQGVDSFEEVSWKGDLSYGDLFLQAEWEHCTYEFELAQVENLRQQYRLFEDEARSCLERGLVLPAHDHVLRCSHTFNVLDARGAVGVTERAQFFARMRELSRQVAAAFLDQRQAAGFPLGEREAARFLVGGPALPVPGEQAPPGRQRGPRLALLEIGVEELPARDLQEALAQLEQLAPQLLEEHRLACGRVEIEGTPRRLAILLHDLEPEQRPAERVVRGPPETVAYHDGQPTPAGKGFARKQGVRPEELEVLEEGGKRYVAVRHREAGRPAGVILQELWPALLAGLRFPLAMRWNASGVTFSRPIRWLLALHGQGVVSFEYAGVASGRATLGLRGQGSPRRRLGRAEEYLSLLEEEGILLSAAERRMAVDFQARDHAAQLGGEPLATEDLVAEVADLAEAPLALTGSFPPEALELPRPVLEMVLTEHQRFFPIQDGEGELVPYFVAFANGAHVDPELVRRGNEAVVRGRLADARFFYEHDLERSLEEHARRLETLTFHEKLGSYAHKTARLGRLAARLAEVLLLGPEARSSLLRAAELCKADLVTQLVVEFTQLEGVLGGHYARLQGEPEAVARAIEEHYRPRSSGDRLPETEPGVALALADRLDTLVGLFAHGLAPSGSADPFGLRRAALGLIEILVGRRLEPGLDALLAAALQAYREAGQELPQDPGPALLDFLRRRLEASLLEAGFRHDVVQAVLAEQAQRPYPAWRGVEELQRWVADERFAELLPAIARSVRILPRGEGLPPADPALFTEEAEGQLHHAVEAASQQHPRQVDELVRALLPLVEPINWFFEEVLVMAPEEDLRRNRLALLHELVSLSGGILDFSRLEGF